MIINKDDIENFFKEMTNSLKESNFKEVKDSIKDYFNNVRVICNENEFQEILNETRFNNFQKKVIYDVYKNGSDIEDFLSLKMANFSSGDSTKQHIESFENLIFNQDFYDLINKKSDDFDFKNDYIDSILFIKDKVLPNTNLETCAKFYIYIASGNFFNDLKDDDFRKSLNQDKEVSANVPRHGRTQFQYNIGKKISEHLEYWKMSKDYSNDANFSIKREYPNYSFFDFEGSLAGVFHRNTPSGYLDAVMRSPNGDQIFIARANNNLVENDIYNHLESRLLEEKALLSMLNNDKERIVLFDFCKGHNKNLINKFTNQNIEKNDFLEIKKIFDIILHKAVSEITGLNPIIIQVGDRKYNIEQEDFLDLSLSMTDFMKRDDLNFDNKFVMKILEKTTEWMVTNLMENSNFYIKENIEKCEKYLKNVYELKEKHSINTRGLNREIDHLENKINNLEKSNQKLLIEEAKEKIVSRINYLNDNGILAYAENKDMHGFLNLRNDIVDKFYNTLFILQSNSYHEKNNPDFFEPDSSNPLKDIPLIKNINNRQYEILDKVANIEIYNRNKISQTLKDKIRINDPLLRTLYELKDGINNFQKNYDLKFLEGIKKNFVEIENFSQRKGPIYNFFASRDKFTTDISLISTRSFFRSECNLEVTFNMIDIFVEDMPKKINKLNKKLNTELSELKYKLNEINKVQSKLINRERIDEKDIPKSSERIVKFNV